MTDCEANRTGGGRLGDWAVNEQLVAQETALLARLHADLRLQQQLILVTEDMLAVGLVLIYALGKNSYGCHCLRDKASGYRYLPTTNIREATRAGRFTTLPD